MTSLAMQRRRATAGRVWKQFRTSRQGMIGLGVLLVFVLMALAAPLLADVRELNPVYARAQGNPQWAPPGEFPPLGTDYIRRSVWAQFVWGSRVSLFVGLAATFLTILIGSVVGIVASLMYGDFRVDRSVSTLRAGSSTLWKWSRSEPRCEILAKMPSSISVVRPSCTFSTRSSNSFWTSR